MLRITNADALTAVRDAIATMPTDADARSDFFVQWRARTSGGLDLLFAHDPEPSRQFKEIEFSPRRLTKDDTKDEQLRLDAYLSGCAAARAFLETLLRRISGDEASAGERAAGAPPPERLATAAATGPEYPSAPTVRPPPATSAPAPPMTVPPVSAPPVSVMPSPAHSLATEAVPVVMASVAADAQPELIIKGAAMEVVDTCAPVRNSLSRVLGAWDRGDRDAAAMVSAQLLAELTLLAHHERFKAAFASVVERSFPAKSVPAEVDALKAAAPLCVWSVVAAMNEVMKG